MISLPNRPGIGTAVLGGLGLAYPFVVYGAMGRVPAGALVVVALALVGARLGALRGKAVGRNLVRPLVAVAVATLLLAVADPDSAALAYPVLMSLGMAAAFGLSLWRGPPLVEVFASLREPVPGPEAQGYLRAVTWVWFVFLLTNAAISAATGLSGDLAVWTLYNGLASYLLMGLLFAVEWVVRRRVRRS
jgi:uncharacterized membrane protein